MPSWFLGCNQVHRCPGVLLLSRAMVGNILGVSSAELLMSTGSLQPWRVIQLSTSGRTDYSYVILNPWKLFEALSVQKLQVQILKLVYRLIALEQSSTTHMCKLHVHSRHLDSSLAVNYTTYVYA